MTNNTTKSRDKKFLETVETAQKLLKEKQGDLDELREGYYRSIAYCIENKVSEEALIENAVKPELIRQIRKVWRL